MFFLGEQVPDALMGHWKKECDILGQFIRDERKDPSALKYTFSTVLRELKSGGCKSDFVLCFADLLDTKLLRHVVEQFDDNPIVCWNHLSFTDETGAPYGYIYLRNIPGLDGQYCIHRVVMVLPNYDSKNPDSSRHHVKASFRWDKTRHFKHEYLENHFTLYKELVFEADTEYKIGATREKCGKGEMVVTQYQICNKAQPEVAKWMDRSQLLYALGQKGLDSMEEEHKARWAGEVLDSGCI